VNGLLLPIVLVFVLKLANDRRIMGEHRNGAFAKIVGAGAALMAGALSIALVAVTLLGI
jgi:Mn2+/Fe2+ NRAMP family transporter